MKKKVVKNLAIVLLSLSDSVFDMARSSIGVDNHCGNNTEGESFFSVTTCMQKTENAQKAH